MSTAAKKRDPRKYVASKHVTRSRYALGLTLAAVLGVLLVSLVDFGSTAGARGAGDGPANQDGCKGASLTLACTAPGTLVQ